MNDDTPLPPGQRSFTLGSDDAYDALCPRADRPWIPNGALPREPRWPRPPAEVAVLADSDEEGADAVRNWLSHVEAGRIG